MTAELITTNTKTVHFPAEKPQSWDVCDDCWDVPPVPGSFAHIVIFSENEQLLASTECGQQRFQFAVAGHLALAGVRIGPWEAEGACQLLDPEQIGQAVAALNSAGADVTVMN